MCAIIDKTITKFEIKVMYKSHTNESLSIKNIEYKDVHLCHTSKQH